MVIIKAIEMVMGAVLILLSAVMFNGGWKRMKAFCVWCKLRYMRCWVSRSLQIIGGDK